MNWISDSQRQILHRPFVQSIEDLNYFIYVLSEWFPPSLTWRPLNFSSGLSTRGRVRRGSPMGGSDRCGGGGFGTAIWVGWKLLITHVTWWKEEQRGRGKKEGRDSFHCSTEMDDFLVGEMLRVPWEQILKRTLAVWEGQRQRDKERGRKNEIWEEEVSKEILSLRDELQGTLWSLKLASALEAFPENWSRPRGPRDHMTLFECAMVKYRSAHWQGVKVCACPQSRRLFCLKLNHQSILPPSLLYSHHANTALSLNPSLIQSFPSSSCPTKAKNSNYLPIWSKLRPELDFWVSVLPFKNMM